MFEEYILPTSRECIANIKEKIPVEDLYEQLAEEAAELAQAANKMARAMRGTNPTPKSEMEAYHSVIEEYTDVINVAGNILDILPDWSICNYKLHRWNKRLEETENDGDTDIHRTQDH